MIEAVSMPSDGFPSLAVRTQRLVAWAAALALFLSVGWLALAPDDPLGPVSLLTHRHALMMWIQAILLSVVCSFIATILAGRHLPHAGLFAAALGLSALSLRGETSRYFLVNCTSEPSVCQRWLALSFAGEALGWFVVIAAALPAAALVIRWCGWTSAIRENSPRSIGVSSAEAAASPRQALRPDGPGNWVAAVLANSFVQHVLIVAGGLLLAVALLSSGLSQRTVRHGQSCFIIFAATLLAVKAGCRIAPVPNPCGTLLAVPLAAVTGYLWAAVTAGRFAALPQLPSSCFLRVLPLQFIAVGLGAAVVGWWWLSGGGEWESHAEKDIEDRECHQENEPRSRSDLRAPR